MDIAGLKRDLEGLEVEDNPTLVRQKSRDFFWYSPVLKRQLDHIVGDLVAAPATEADVVRIVAAAFARGVPVTPRGAGTGNYGQAMPLSGGLVLNLAKMAAVRTIGEDFVVAEAGAVLEHIDDATRAAKGREMRMHPSTYRMATAGGFLAGGSGGVGSVRWGGLRAPGNVRRVRIVTCEQSPRVMDLTGADLAKVLHAYGVNGIITEVELPIEPAPDWIDVVVAFDEMMDGIRFAAALGESDRILVKEIAPIAAPVPYDYFARHRKFLRREQSVVLVMVAPSGVDALADMTRAAGGEIAYRVDKASDADRKGLPPVYELAWNHTTLRALRIDPSITYLQTLYPDIAAIETMMRRFGDEVPIHCELMRSNGRIIYAGLPIVRFTSEERLDEIVRIHEDHGCPVSNPHRYTIEEGGGKRVDMNQLGFKRETDPKGLLNPGKMIGWHEPDFDFQAGRPYAFPGLRKAA